MNVVDFGEKVGAHGSVRVLPVAETVAVVAWVAAEVDDDAHKDQTDKGHNFDAAEPELELSEYADAE